jgi:hypothetical protein
MYESFFILFKHYTMIYILSQEGDLCYNLFCIFMDLTRENRSPASKETGHD